MQPLELPDIDLETKFDAATTSEQNAHMCPDCNIPLLLDFAEYRCPQCMRSVDACITVADAANSTKRNWTVDPTKSQRMATLRSLEALARDHKGDEIPHDVLDEVSGLYQQIQQGATEEEVRDGVVVCKKFVRRGNNKDQILAYLIHVVCIKKLIIRSRQCICSFMKLRTNGFSQGEEAVREFQEQGIIANVCIDDEPIECFILRWFDLLKIDIKYAAQVRDLVNVSIKKRICMQSKHTSKIVGAMWWLIQKHKLEITIPMLERATETKKTTFMTFFNEINNNPKAFAGCV